MRKRHDYKMLTLDFDGYIKPLSVTMFKYTAFKVKGVIFRRKWIQFLNYWRWQKS